MAVNALKSAGLAFDLIRSEDIQSGALSNYAMLFVPGGWASNKLKSLGENGSHEIRRFVEEGGNYLGFCGGAGLATLDGVGLLKIRRIPTRNRVPSFSGPVRLKLAAHSIWDGIVDPVFHAWWPSQFSIEDQSISVLASYHQALSASFSSDLNVGDIINQGGDWESLEKSYGINLDPSRLYGQPAVVEGRFGKGKVILSLIHFDTPDDPNGTMVLKRLWEYMAEAEGRKIGCAEVMEQKSKLAVVDDVQKMTGDLIRFGESNLLWSWRNPILLQWKRGIRGLEYCTLHIMVEALNENIDCAYNADFLERMNEIQVLLSTFKAKSESLLSLERDALRNGNRITYEKSDNPEIIQLRTELFANSKSYGGEFKALLDKIDGLVFRLLN